jgi:RNA polymerase sigma-70 factor (ECF subfamily)
MTEHYTERQRKVLVDALSRKFGDIAEDAVQQAAASLFIHKDTITDWSTIASWMYTVSFRKVCTMIKSENRQRRTKEKIADKVSRSLDFSDNPLSLVIQSENSVLVKKAVSSLSDSLREIVEDFYYNDLSYEQIAAKRKICKSTVTARLNRAREVLRAKLSHLVC